MLGLRLDSELANRLEAAARRTGQSKSGIVRDALRAYLVSGDVELGHELRLIAAATRAEDLALLDALHDDLPGHAA